MRKPTHTIRPRHREKGQTTIFVVVALGIFLIGFVGFGVDMTNLWFRRQKAQGAADAACQACAMNLLLAAQGTPTPTQGFTVGTAFNCASNPNTSACKYALLNGYNGAGLVANTESNAVEVTFPGSVPGVTPPSGTLAPIPFVKATVIDRARVFFSAFLTGDLTYDVGASAVCGLQQAKSPIPLIVLNPNCPHAFEVSGSATARIVGGPNKSVQVNSINQTCAAATQSGGCSGSGTIDLQFGGPNFTGSNFGVFGAPSTPPPNFLPGSTGAWVTGSPIGDPYAQTPPPAVPGTLGVVTNVVYGASGCPDQSGCKRYQPGLYTQPIVVKNETAIFDPGIYYIKPTDYTAVNDGRSATYCSQPGNGCSPGVSGLCTADFAVDANGVVRPSTEVGDGSGGAMFYLSGPGIGTRPYGSVFFGANAGNPGGRTIDSYNTAGITCPGGTPPDPSLGLPGTVDGNVLLGQCTAGGSWYPYQPIGPVRGILFFQDHANRYGNGQPSMQGGGGLLLSGTLYFHNCTATPCNPPPTDYQAFFQLQGTPGSGTFVLGNITSDQLVLGGNGTIAMQLDPNAVYNILKVAMLR